MNVMKIVVSFIVLLYLVFILINLFSTAFPKDEIVKTIETQINLSKKNPGEFNSKYNLKFEEGLLLTKKDFETKDTIIEFQCNSYTHCCAENDKCNEKIEWTKEKARFNEKRNPITSTRCDEIKGSYFCKIYLGEIPAQIQLEEFNYNNNFYFNSEKLKIDSKITNKGNTTENYARMETTVSIIFFENGIKKEEILKEENTERIKIEARETKELTQEIKLESPGEYTVKTKITGLDFGFVEEKFNVNVFGEPEYNCRIDETKKEITIDPDSIGENKIIECEIAFYCSDCKYGFECKYEWQKQFPYKELELKTKEYTIEHARGTNCQ
ncbi:MAG: hypothetical protein COT90_02535 [Candidatus Diapherotrites archaeon CG10_big_fil_rev_8_21_14_0_10_31_34]|nr:MAG: hypothetical protein COT90_02535 [Candidatus Diapherotrites archaeon CG10_big_fil_rev_8_21_14_0_10_31_34]PJA18232.1 MAG: hypothetical protein COX63_02325 [Candidatus Diapherotrites archaeon CG_4_10_14_0_2_um_filter_31_5]